MWNEQKPFCLSEATRKPFECSYNFHEAQTFAAAYFIQIQVIAGFFRIYLRICSFSVTGQLIFISADAAFSE